MINNRHKLAPSALYLGGLGRIYGWNIQVMCHFALTTIK